MTITATISKGSDLEQLLREGYFEGPNGNGRHDRRNGLAILVNLSLETFDPWYPPSSNAAAPEVCPEMLKNQFWFKFYADDQFSPETVVLYLPAVRRRDADGRYRLHLSEWVGRSALVRLIQSMERMVPRPGGDPEVEEKKAILRKFRRLCRQVRVYLHADTRKPDDDEVDYAFSIYFPPFDEETSKKHLFKSLGAWHEEPAGCRRHVRKIFARLKPPVLLLATSTGDPFCIREKAYGEASFRYNLLIKVGAESLSKLACERCLDGETDPTHCAACEHYLLLHKIHQQRLNFPERVLARCSREWRADGHDDGVEGAVGLGALLTWIADDFDLMRSWKRIVRAMHLEPPGMKRESSATHSR